MVAPISVSSCGDPVRGIVDSGHPGGRVGGDDDRFPRGDGVDVEHPVVGGSPAEFDEQVDGPLRGDGRHRRVDAAFEPFARLAAELLSTAGAGDRHRIPVRGLEEQVGGLLRHLGGRSTHDRRQRDRHRCRRR